MENSFYIYIYNKYSKFIHKYNVQSSNKKWENFHCFCNPYFFKFKNFQFSVFNLKEFAMSSIYIKLKKNSNLWKKNPNLLLMVVIAYIFDSKFHHCHRWYVRWQVLTLLEMIGLVTYHQLQLGCRWYIIISDNKLVVSDRFLSAVPKSLSLIITLIVNVILLLATASQFMVLQSSATITLSAKTTVVAVNLSRWSTRDNFLIFVIGYDPFSFSFQTGPPPPSHPIFFGSP